MISTKKLAQLAKKWKKLAVANRRRLSWPKLVANKGHFVVYTTDKRRFMIPLTYLKSEILRELFFMAGEEFGVTSDRPITLPCDSFFMDYVLSILRRHITEDLEKALVLSMGPCRSFSSSYSQQDKTNQQVLVSSF